MKLLKYLLVGATGSALLLAGGTLADPPLVGQLRAGDAVPVSQTLASTTELAVGSRLTVDEAMVRSDLTLPDFRSTRDVTLRKKRFLNFLLPLVQAENVRLTAIRTRLSYIYDHVRWRRELSTSDRAWLQQVSREFALPLDDPARPEFWEAAFERIDAVPEELVLVQAANESGWGTSRFAREGNNLFGQWCFREGCGIVPAGRPADANYEVARYASISESIGSYVHNLNTGGTYQLLREIRSRMREKGEEPDAVALTAGLTEYSARGMAYVNELRAMIRQNADILADLRLRSASDRKS
jgi:Bax protein